MNFSNILAKVDLKRVGGAAATFGIGVILTLGSELMKEEFLGILKTSGASAGTTVEPENEEKDSTDYSEV